MAALAKLYTNRFNHASILAAPTLDHSHSLAKDPTSKKELCLRYHITRSCNSKCNHKDTHKAYSTDIMNSLHKFLDKCAVPRTD